MKTYWRILAYSLVYKARILGYVLSTIGMVVFGGLAFVLIQPLLEVLFNEANTGTAGAMANDGKGMLDGLDTVLSMIVQEAKRVSETGGQSRGLLFVASLVVGSNLLGNFFRYLSNVCLADIRTGTIKGLRDDVYKSLIKKDIAYIEGRKKGDIISRIISDVSEIEHSIVNSFESVVRDPLNIIYVLALMLHKSWSLTLFIFLVLPISAILIGRITKALKREAHVTQSLFGQMLSLVEEGLGGIRNVKAYIAEGYLLRLFSKANHEYSETLRKQWRRRALVPIFSESLMVAVVGLVMWYGGMQVYEGALGKAEFIAYLGYFFVLSRPAKSFSQAFSNVSKGIASGQRVFELMDAEAEIEGKEGGKKVEPLRSALEMRDVGFHYVADKWVLQDLNMRFEQGKMYGIVGTSGGGKSTLVELLMRFYDPKCGAVLWDGTDLKQVDVESLRSHIAIVTQEPILFHDTIENNILFGREEQKSREAIKEASVAAYADGFIEATTEGYQSIVGDRGGLLSGGQRQRISLARALLGEPSVLILDEATSALDTESEQAIQRSLELWKGRCCMIVIAHRLSTVRHADEIIVLDKGKVVEQGRHDSLMEAEGKYWRMVQNQNNGG